VPDPLPDERPLSFWADAGGARPIASEAMTIAGDTGRMEVRP